MSEYRFRFNDEAVAEYEAAARYYVENGGFDVAERFVSKVDTVIELLEMWPDAGDVMKGVDGVKSARIPKYPYRIYYKLDKDGLEVIGLSVFHSKRDIENFIPDLEKRLKRV